MYTYINIYVSKYNYIVVISVYVYMNCICTNRGMGFYHYFKKVFLRLCRLTLVRSPWLDQPGRFTTQGLQPINIYRQFYHVKSWKC